ncbi:12325_t:CDS:2, partial [Cetraspora pellucida]
PENSSKQYYQLIVSDKMWLKLGHDYDQFCFRIDGKYDLNNKKTPVLAIVIENQAGYRSSLAFGLNNKENHHIIQMAVQAVKVNISYDDPTYSIQALLTNGITKNCNAKLHKPSQFSYSNNVQFNETETSYIDEINQECANYDSLEDLLLSEILINNIENTSKFAELYSIYRHNTTKIQNKHRSHTQIISNNEQENDVTFTTKKLLEELFLEKNMLGISKSL